MTRKGFVLSVEGLDLCGFLSFVGRIFGGRIFLELRRGREGDDGPAVEGLAALRGMRVRLGMWVLGVGCTVMRCIVRMLEGGEGNGVRSGRWGAKGGLCSRRVE